MSDGIRRLRVAQDGGRSSISPTTRIGRRDEAITGRNVPQDAKAAIPQKTGCGVPLSASRVGTGKQGGMRVNHKNKTKRGRSHSNLRNISNCDADGPASVFPEKTQDQKT